MTLKVEGCWGGLLEKTDCGDDVLAWDRCTGEGDNLGEHDLPFFSRCNAKNECRSKTMYIVVRLHQRHWLEINRSI